MASLKTAFLGGSLEFSLRPVLKSSCMKKDALMWRGILFSDFYFSLSFSMMSFSASTPTFTATDVSVLMSWSRPAFSLS